MPGGLSEGFLGRNRFSICPEAQDLEVTGPEPQNRVRNLLKSRPGDLKSRPGPFKTLFKKKYKVEEN